MQLKTTHPRKNLYRINKNGLYTNTSKIDGIAFYFGAHIQQAFRKLISNLTGSEPLPQV